MRTFLVFVGIVLFGSISANRQLKLLKESVWSKYFEQGVIGARRESVRNSPAQCENGVVLIDGEEFPCDSVDFLSFVALSEMEIISRPHVDTGIRASDIWGWKSPKGREVTIICMDNGVAFVDTTDYLNPCTIGTLASPRPAASWCDIKIHNNTAYIVKDTSGGDSEDNDEIGGQVFDLLRLEKIVNLDNQQCPDTPIILNHDYMWDFHGSAHNLAINTETGFLYSMGGDKCEGGLMFIDLNQNRLKPQLVHCADQDGYTHDAQCVIYRGPDTRFTGRELCFAFNEQYLTIWDVTFKFAPALLSKVTYPSQVYTHQGWLTDDMSMVLMDDELNEYCAVTDISLCNLALGEIDGETRTSTLVVNVTDLLNPIYVGKYLHEDSAIDHNLYLWGPIYEHGWGGSGKLPRDKIPNPNYAYMHNYLAGLRILDVSGLTPDKFVEVGFIDIAPDLDDVAFLGTWSGYLHPSGVYALSSVERGLFLLNFTKAFDNVIVVKDDDDTTTEEGNASVIVSILALSMMLVSLILTLFFMYKSEPTPRTRTAAEEGEPKPLVQVTL